LAAASTTAFGSIIGFVGISSMNVDSLLEILIFNCGCLVVLAQKDSKDFLDWLVYWVLVYWAEMVESAHFEVGLVCLVVVYCLANQAAKESFPAVDHPAQVDCHFPAQVEVAALAEEK
jgi:hypothetical protein